VRLDPDNNVQPDSFLRHRDGTSKHTDDDYLEGPPELVFEIAASSASVDLGPKLRAYRRNGVKEYIVWQVWDKRLDWFELDDDAEYQVREPDADGLIESRVFPGLRLAVQKLLDEDLTGVLAELSKTY
jgi:Uma2 family endonuclease